MLVYSRCLLPVVVRASSKSHAMEAPRSQPLIRTLLRQALMRIIARAQGGSYAPNGPSGSLAVLANGGSTGALNGNGNGYGSGNGNGNGNGTASDSFRHSQAAATAQGKKNGDAREGALSPREGRANGMAIYDRAAVGEQDEDGHGGGRKKGGFWSLICCRA